MGPELENYMQSLYDTLGNDYRTPEGNFSESCGDIAATIAELLLREGEKPLIATVWGKSVDDLDNRATLVPRRFEGRVKWGAHHVCCVGDEVYDPMVATFPLNIESYLRAAFNDEVVFKRRIFETEIEEFLSR